MKGPAHVTVAAAREGEELVLTVSNSAESGDQAAAGQLPSRHRTRIGINNTRERLRNRYGSRGKLVAGPTDGGYRAVIRLPFTMSR
jgi:LytS/YehU family sensor histidine kinase